MSKPLIDSDNLAAWCATHYGFSRVAIHPIRSYTNDAYWIDAGGERFVLKIYGRGWRTESDIQYEVALLLHLVAHGVPVAPPIAAIDGGYVRAVSYADGEHLAVLFAAAPGEKPQPPFMPPLYEAFGRAIAQFHAASGSFVAAHPRQPLGLAQLLDEPIHLARTWLAESQARWLQHLAETIRNYVLPHADELDWGPIHGDATLDNLHVTPGGGVILYDFDSGGPGWRAADLQGWAINQPNYQLIWHAYLRGYRSVRSVADADLQAAPYLALATEIWGLKVDLERHMIARGAEHVQAYLHTELANIHTHAVQYGVLQ